MAEGAFLNWRHVNSRRGFDRGLNAVMDSSIAGVVLVAPWFMGGRHPLGHFVLTMLALLGASAWALKGLLYRESTSLPRSFAYGLLGLCVALVAVQLAPLPWATVDGLSPYMIKVLPLWSANADAAVGLGHWNQVSLAPADTRASLAILISYVLLFVVAVARLRETDDIERLLKLLAFATVAMALVGLLQYLAGNGKFLWIYQHPLREPVGAAMGPFINRNHFAHFLALGIGPLLYAFATHGRRDRAARKESFGDGGSGSNWSTPLYLFALGLVLFAGLMSFSRGGAGVLALSSLFTLALFYRAGAVSRSFLGAIAGVFVLLGAALAIHGYTQVTERLDDYASGSIHELDAAGLRRAIWTADAQATREFWLLGCGAGTHRHVYPLFFPQDIETVMTHAENGYLQIAMETGLPGVALLLLTLALVGAWCVAAMRAKPSRRVGLLSAAIGASLLASVFHSVADFVWYIPALMAIVTLLCACALRLSLLASTSGEAVSSAARQPAVWRLSPAFHGVLLACIVVGGGWAASNRFRDAMASPAWDRQIAFAHSPEVRSGQWSPTADDARNLEEALAWVPDDPAIHIRLAKTYFRLFEIEQAKSPNPMGINMIRDAALQSQFGSRAALDAWLSRACGPHAEYLDKMWRHARSGVQCCPLEGDGYVYLAETCFLAGMREASRNDYKQQAIAVRPYSPVVMLFAGSEEYLYGDEKLGDEYWRRVLNTPCEEQSTVAAMLAQLYRQVTAEAVLARYQPNLDALRRLQEKYVAAGGAKAAAPFLNQFVRLAAQKAATLPDEQAAPLWYDVSTAYYQLEQRQPMFECLDRSLKLDPSNFQAHFVCGVRNKERGNFAEAEKHLAWCSARRPDDAALQAELNEVRKAAVDARSQVTASAPLERR